MGTNLKHTDLHDKCGSCAHATPRPQEPFCVICNLNPELHSIYRRTTRRCPNYIFDPTKLCPCGETPEPWYNYCPSCGRKIKEEE